MSTTVTRQTPPHPEPPIVGFLAHVRSSVAQLRLYPKDSAQVLKVCTAAYQAFLTALGEQDSVTLNHTPQGLLVNGVRLPGTGATIAALEQGMVRLLSESSIKSATFRRGLALDELITFLHALTHKFWDVKEGKDINVRLRSERVTRISVDEVEYVALGQGDLVIKDAARRLEAAHTRAAEVLKTLESLVEGSVDPGTATEIRLQVLKKLLEHDPTLLERARVEGAETQPGPPAGAGDLDARTGGMSFETARQALGDLARQMQAADAEGRARLQRVAEAIVGAFRRSTELHGIMRQFLRESASDLLPAWLREAEDERPKEPAAVARVRTILALEPEDRIAAIARETASLAKELEALGRADLVVALLDTLVGFVGDRAAARRSSACDALCELQGAAESDAAAGVRDRLAQEVQSALDAEEDTAVYPKLASVATLVVEGRIRQGALRAAMPVLDLLRRHAQVKEGGFPRRSEQAFQALERVASGGGFAVVQERLREGDPDAFRLVEGLDAAAARFLVGQIKSTEAVAERVRYAETIARAGASAAAVLIDATQKTTAPSDALRLMEVLPSAAPQKMVEVALDGLLRHPAIAVRRRAALMLAERGYPRAGSIILGALREETDPAVRTTFVEALGDLRYKDAVEVLLELADGRTEADEVRSEACVALGRIAERAAVPVLVRLAGGGGGGLTKLFRAVAREVRVAATRALGSFPTDLTAREALRRLTSDPLPSVRAAAQEAQESPLLAVPSARSATRDPRALTWKLAGALAEVPLDQICQLVSSAQKTGLLTLHLEGRKARVWFEEGLVVAAQYETWRDQEAFNAFCRRHDGHFSFRPHEKAPERRMKAPVAQLLLEAFRVADEAKKEGTA